MNREELQQKIRRSSSFSSQEIEQFYLEYVKMVKDQQNVFEYMEENKIGIDNPNYWLARFQSLERQCQYKKLANLIYKINKNINIKKNPNYYKILQYEKELDKKFIHKIKSHFHGKRSVKDYEGMANYLYSKKRIRKFGNIQVYVDDQNQRNYSLEDNAVFIEENMRDTLQFDINTYQRDQATKQISFITKKQQHLQKLAEQMLKKQENQNRKSRVSLQSIKIHKLLQNDSITTPRHEHKIQLTKSPPLQEMDSIQILKKKVWRKKYQGQISPKFLTPVKNPQNQNEPKQNIRFETRILPQFSFGCIDHSQQQLQGVNEGRIEYNSQDQFDEVDKSADEFNLGLIIQQCNNKITETQTFTTEVNSNQQNQQFRIQFKPHYQQIVRLSLLEKQNYNDQISLEQLLEYSINMDTLKPPISNQKAHIHKKDISYSQRVIRKSELSIISQEKSHSFSHIKINKPNLE